MCQRLLLLFIMRMSITRSDPHAIEVPKKPPHKTASEHRKATKPIMEKRRRARINNSLEQLKTLILQAHNKDVSITLYFCNLVYFFCNFTFFSCITSNSPKFNIFLSNLFLFLFFSYFSLLNILNWKKLIFLKWLFSFWKVFNINKK